MRPQRPLLPVLLLCAAAAGCEERRLVLERPQPEPGTAPRFYETEADEGPARLTVWETYGPQEHKLFLELVEEYEGEHPDVDIEVEHLPFGGHQDKLLTAIMTRTAPDICRLDAVWVYRLAMKGVLRCLDRYGAGEVSGEYVPAAMASCTVHGRVYGLPDQVTCVALVRNRALFREAGLPDRGPESWDELVDFARRLTDREEGRFGFAMRNGMWWSYPFFGIFGAKVLSDDGRECLLDEEPAVDALRLKVSLYQEHEVEAGAWRPGAITPEAGFVSGRYAMYFDGPWRMKQLRESGVDFAVERIPPLVEGGRSATNIGGTNMVVLDSCRRAEAAYQFLRFVTGRRVQARWAEELEQIPVNLGAFAAVDTSEKPELRTFMEQIRTAVPRPNIMKLTEFDEIIGAEMELALSGQRTPEEALRRMVKRVEAEVLPSGREEVER